MPTIRLKRKIKLKGGQYVMDQKLNSGATAVIWGAEDVPNNRRVALKITDFEPGLATKGILMKHVKAEIKNSSGLYHKNVAKLLDVFVEKDRCLVTVWELVEGMDLLDMLQTYDRSRLPEDMAGYIFFQLLSAVTFLHEEGVCHRDIKPENCMISSGKMDLKLVDFGLSSDLDAVSTYGCGTPNYMPPELLEPPGTSCNPSGPAYCGIAVDTWAMGVVLYAMVCGALPFEGRHHAITIDNICSGRMREIPSYVTQGCTSLIRSLLQRRPEDRLPLTEVQHNKWMLQSAAAFSFRANSRKAQSTPIQTQSGSSLKPSGFLRTI